MISGIIGIDATLQPPRQCWSLALQMKQELHPS